MAYGRIADSCNNIGGYASGSISATVYFTYNSSIICFVILCVPFIALKSYCHFQESFKFILCAVDFDIACYIISPPSVLIPVICDPGISWISVVSL